MGILFQSTCSSAACRTISKLCTNFSRLCEHIVIELKHDSIIFSGVNSLKSAFVSLSFDSSFFDTFSWSNVDQSQSTFAYSLRVPSKSLSTLFKTINSLKSNALLAKTEDTDQNCTCTISFNPGNCKLSISTHFDYALSKVTDIFYEEAEAAYPIFNDSATFDFCVGSPAKTILEWVSCFNGQCKQDEIVFDFLDERAIVSVRSSMLLDQSQPRKNTTTKLSIKRHQFDEYCLATHRSQQVNSAICISFFDFRTVLLMAACLEADISIKYEAKMEEPVMLETDGCQKGTCKLKAILARNSNEDVNDLMLSHLSSGTMMSAFPTDIQAFQQHHVAGAIEEENEIGLDSDSEEYIPSTPPSKRYASGHE